MQSAGSLQNNEMNHYSPDHGTVLNIQEAQYHSTFHYKVLHTNTPLHPWLCHDLVLAPLLPTHTPGLASCCR